MMMYNADFLIAAVVILLLVLRNFLDQKRAEDLNSRVFLFFVVIGILDVIAELVSNYYITSGDGDFGLAAVVTTTIFYLFQALLPYNFRRWGLWPGCSGDHNYFLSVSGIASIYTSLLYYDIAR